jgi:hypothetical protein
MLSVSCFKMPTGVPDDSITHAPAPTDVCGRLGPGTCHSGPRWFGRVEIPPSQRLDWHWHPGEEFHYYFEGDPGIERADAPPVIGEPVTVGQVAFKQRHKAAAGDQGRRL